MMMRPLHKVTAFILHPAPAGSALLLIQHPHAGNQIPAGTVEPGEDPLVAARREAHEETGLSDLPEPVLLESRIYNAPEGFVYTLQPSPVFSRPDPGSFSWARFRCGVQLRLLRQQDGYTQVSFEEPDTYPDSSYITYNITGWVPESVLGRSQLRHFYRFDFKRSTPARWQVSTDNHLFTLFWAPLIDLPEIVPPQDQWIEIVRRSENLSNGHP